jgi:hypothetical protein
MWKCNPSRWRVSIAATVLVFLFPRPPLFGQALTIPERVSPDTLYYMQWCGLASLSDAQRKNHLLLLLQDPDFAPLWKLAADKLHQGLNKENTYSAPELADMISLLDNPAAFGVVTNSVPAKTSVPSSAPSLFGVFAVYDASGKVDLVQRLRALAKSAGSGAPVVTTYDFNGTLVEAQTSGKSASYSARVSHYFLFASEKQIIEDLITRFQGAAKPDSSLAELPEYKAVRKYSSSDVAIEFFAHVPNLDKLISPEQKGKPAARLIHSLHLDKIHVAGGSMSFAGEATRIQGAVLGEASPGSLFEVAGPSGAVFQAQPIVGSSPIFSFSRMNFVALYELIHGAVLGTLTEQQASNVTTAEAMAQNFLGMSIRDVFALFTGEFASTTSYAEDGSSLHMFVLTIQKPDDVLRVLRAVAASMIVAEDTSGGTTYLDLSFPYQDPATHTERRKFYYVAVTPQMVLTAPQKAMLRQAVDRLSSEPAAAPASGILRSAEYLRMRSLLPEKLSGLSAADIAAIPWSKMIPGLTGQVAHATMQSQGSNPRDLSWLQGIKPDVFPRHIHITVSGWWKDSNGIYFDSYIQ